MESIVGKILCDRYRIVRELSQDDFGTVFDAEDLGQPKQAQCQIEMLQPSYDSEVLGAKSWQKVSQEFVNQGNILKNISQHPQIPQLLAFFECDRHFYLVREFIKGQTLSQKLEQSLITEAEAINWLQEILSTLDFIHQAGIIHLNIQPSSLIEQDDGKKFLTNFSSIRNAILFEDRSHKSIANHNFSSSRKFDSEDNFNPDIYALGKTITYALTGDIDNAGTSDLLPTRLTSVTENKDKLSVKIRPELADLLEKMVEEHSDQCYRSAAEVLDELDFSKQVVTLPPPMFTDFQPSRKKARKNQNSARSKTSKSNSKNKQQLIWLLLTLPFIVALGIVFIGINKNAYDNFVDYDNANYQFKIKYPQDWSAQDLDDPITGDVVVFSSPLESSSDLFKEKVYLTVEYLASADTTIEEYTKNVVARIEQTQGSGIEVQPNSQITISKLPTRTIVYDRQSENLPLKQMEVFTVKNDRIFIAIYTAEKANFNKFSNTAEKMINSWKIE